MATSAYNSNYKTFFSGQPWSSICRNTLCLPPILLHKLLNHVFKGQDFIKVIILAASSWTNENDFLSFENIVLGEEKKILASLSWFVPSELVHHQCRCRPSEDKTHFSYAMKKSFPITVSLEWSYTDQPRRALA